MNTNKINISYDFISCQNNFWHCPGLKQHMLRYCATKKMTTQAMPKKQRKRSTALHAYSFDVSPFSASPKKTTASCSAPSWSFDLSLATIFSMILSRTPTVIIERAPAPA